MELPCEKQFVKIDNTNDTYCRRCWFIFRHGLDWVVNIYDRFIEPKGEK